MTMFLLADYQLNLFPTDTRRLANIVWMLAHRLAQHGPYQREDQLQMSEYHV